MAASSIRSIPSSKRATRIVATTLIVPGLHGSGPGHWQHWWQSQVPDALTVAQADWETPDLQVWSGTVGRAIDQAPAPVWIVAHSFGCLAAVKAALGRSRKVAGLFLVAPADPLRFHLLHQLPVVSLSIPGLLLASSNDPWMRLMNAAWWAERWGFALRNLGPVGHVNTDSGFGPWPQGLALFRQFVSRHRDGFRGDIQDEFHLLGAPDLPAPAGLRGAKA